MKLVAIYALLFSAFIASGCYLSPGYEAERTALKEQAKTQKLLIQDMSENLSDLQLSITDAKVRAAQADAAYMAAVSAGSDTAGDLKLALDSQTQSLEAAQNQVLQLSVSRAAAQGALRQVEQQATDLDVKTAGETGMQITEAITGLLSLAGFGWAQVANSKLKQFRAEPSRANDQVAALKNQIDDKFSLIDRFIDAAAKSPQGIVSLGVTTTSTTPPPAPGAPPA